MKYIASILLFFLFTFSVAAQRFSFVQYSTSKGLPQSQVTSITQDEIGYLWIGTIGGLAKFDGTNFTKYGKNSGLLNNRISKVKWMNDKLYIGHPQGISIQQSATKFTSIVYNDENQYNDVTGFANLNASIYFSTNGAGLFQLLETEEEIKAIAGSPSRIRDLLLYNNNIFLATREGIHVFDGQRFLQIPNTENISFSGLTIQRDTIFATSYNGKLHTIDPVTYALTSEFKSENHLFRSMQFDHLGNKWLFSSDGILVFKPNDTLALTELSGLPTNDINVVFEDSENNIWIGTNGKGLLRFTNEVFTYYNEKYGFPSDLIIAIEIDKRQNKWFSSIDQGVFMKNKLGEITTLDSIPSAVWQIISTDDLVVFASDFGLFTYDYTKLRAFYREDGLPSNRIFGVQELSDSLFIVNTSNGGIGFNKYSQQFKPLNSQLSQINSIRDLKFKNNICYAAAENSIYILQKDSTFNKHFESGLNTIEIDKNGTLWIGTENGLFFLQDTDFQRFYLEDDEHELEYINFIHRYDTVLFVGTNNGLYEVNTYNNSKYRYNINAGLIDLETNLNSSFIEDDKYLWFGTASGLMKMDLPLRHQLLHEKKPRLHLTQVLINNKAIDESQVNILNQQTSLNPLRIKYSEKNIVLHFDGIYMNNPDDLRYTYFLDNFSEDWSPFSKSSVINLVNLSPGKYTLQLKAANSSNSSVIFQVPIHILPPFYKTWWFYTLLGLVVMLSLFAFERGRTRRLKQRNYQLKLEYQNKLTKLEQQSLNANMNRHFVFNSLNSIQYYINISDTKSANKYLSRFAKLIRKNLDSSNVKDGMVSLADEIERLKLYLELESMRFIDKFDYEIIIDKQVEIEALTVPAMLLQPFVENSIIHGLLPLKGKKGKLTIEVSDHLEFVMISIKDNGIGIDFSQASKGNADAHVSQGMTITKKRIELLQKFSERSISIEGPHQINESDRSINGTEVVFKILKQYLS